MQRVLKWLLIATTLLSAPLLGSPEAVPSEMRPLSQEALISPGGSDHVHLPSRWLHGLLQEEVLRVSQWDPEMVEILKLEPRADLRLEERPVSYQIDPPDRVTPGNRVRIRVILYGERGQTLRSAWVSGQVDLYQTAWVLIHAVQSDEVLDRGDISPQRLNVRQIPPGGIEEPGDILGMQARRSLLAGTVLLRDQWEGVSVVHRGQRVRILLETAKMRLVAPGESLEDGSPGERVRVLNLSSKQVVRACIRDNRTVQVEF